MLENVPTQYSPGSFLDLEGRDDWHLYGLACFEHGLRYVAEAKSGEVMSASRAATIRGARQPQPYDNVACDLCGSPLAGPVGGVAELPIRDQTFLDLWHIQQFWRHRK